VGGVIAGVAAGAVGGLLHAIATVTFGVDHVVSGVAINLLGAGVAQYLSQVAYADGQVPGAGPTQSAVVKPDPGGQPAGAVERARPAPAARGRRGVPAQRRRRSARRA
jgi:hypothetical protein